jgi:hypothetical protein
MQFIAMGRDGNSIASVVKPAQCSNRGTEVYVARNSLPWVGTAILLRPSFLWQIASH